MLADRVLHTSTTTGTGSYQLVDPTDPLYRSAIAAVSSGGVFAYSVTMGTSWELCTGVVTAGSPATLTRVLISSSTGSLINWGAGTKTIASIGQADLLRFGGRGSLPTVGGTANAITLTHTTPMRALRAGMEVRFVPTANNSAATTLNVDGLGAIAVVGPTAAACVGNELRSPYIAIAVYDGTSWRLTGLPPMPLVQIVSTSGGNWTLPAGGGTYEYTVTGFTTATGAWNAQYIASEGASGAVIINAAGVTFVGSAKRIA
jgi:hypothetical protein